MKRSVLSVFCFALLASSLLQGGTAQAHVIKTISPSVCDIKWGTPAGAEKMVRCLSNYFGADTPVVLAIVECESGFQASNPNPYSSADGLFQYLAGTWVSEPHRPHGLPGRPGAQRTHGRYAAIVAIRYMVHEWRDGGKWPYGPWQASRYCWAPAL